MGDWNQPRHLVLAQCVITDESDVSFMHIHCTVFLIQCILSHLQHNIIECMRGVYVLIKHSSYIANMFFIVWNLLPQISVIVLANNQATVVYSSQLVGS